MVVLFHLGPALARFGHAGGWPAGLASGVDVFFVISGFVMWMTTRGRTVGTLAFWRKRIVRIVPLYWIVTSVMLAVLLAVPQAMQTSVFSLPHVVASYLFWPALNPGKPTMEPLVFAGWTLNYEMFFYFVFGLFLLARPAVRLWGTAAVLVALVAAGAVAGLPKLSVAGFYTSDVMLEFAYGMVLGEAVFRFGATRPGPVAAAVLAAAGFVLLLTVAALPVALPRSVAYGLPALALVTGALALEQHGRLGEWRVPHAIGNASYSIYLTQLISMAAFFTVVRRLHVQHLPLGLVLFAAADVAVALVVGLLCYRFVERPLVRVFGVKTHHAPVPERVTPG